MKVTVVGSCYVGEPFAIQRKIFRISQVHTIKQPLIFDGRNLYDPKFVRGMGIEYFAIGR